MLQSTQKTEMGLHAPTENLAIYLNQKRGVLRAAYDFATLGGAVGTLYLLDENGSPCNLPSKAIVTQVYVDIITAFVSTSNDGTIALGINASGDLLTAVDADTLSGVSAGTPTGSAATMVKLTADRRLRMDIAVHAMTAGKANFFVEFVLSS